MKTNETSNPLGKTWDEIEMIYDKEVLEPKRQEEWQESQVNRRYSKTILKQFKVGDTVKSLKTIEFIYGGKHFAGNKYVVTKETEAYFNVMHKNYVLVDNSKQFKQFNESLFKAYIYKFSDEDKLKAINCLGGFTIDQTVKAYSWGYGDRDANLPQFHGDKPVEYLNKLK